jgi:5-(carboxyamino)imidazole ribonucleotide mutase
MELLVSVVMGSQSDWDTMQETVWMLEKLEIPCEARVLSAHRTPDALDEYIRDAEQRGVEVFIGAAGGAAHLAGVIAAKTQLPVLGVPMESKALSGIDSLLSMVQMPGGIPVATFAIGKAGAINAALFAASVLALKYEKYADSLRGHRKQQTQKVLAIGDPRQAAKK